MKWKHKGSFFKNSDKILKGNLVELDHLPFKGGFLECWFNGIEHKIFFKGKSSSSQ